MLGHRLALLAALVTGLPFVACASSPQSSPQATGDRGCVPRAPGESCVTHDGTCTCSSATDAGGAADAPPPADLARFLGKWSPISGSGRSTCDGQTTSLPPNPSAVLTFTQDGPSTLAAASSGAAGCVLDLLVSGDTASLARSAEACAVLTGGSVTFTTFSLVFVPAAEAADGGLGPDGDDASAAEGDAGDASASENPGNPPSSEGGAAAPFPQDTLDWQLGDSDGSCVTSLRYTLVRAP